LNSANIVHWNLHKNYLRVLEDAGVDVIPTVWFERGEAVDLQATMRSHNWNDVVIKPVVSASSFRTNRFGIDEADEGQAFLAALTRDRDAMVQVYVPAVEGPGERALVWIDGELTHAIRKSPRFAGGIEQVSEALPVTEDDRAVVDRALACVGDQLLYARVDVVNEVDGKLLLSELELVEPSLFFLQHPAALQRFAAAIGRLHRANP
jgi:hypothetical protein